MKAMQALGKLEQKTKYLAHVLGMVASNELQEEGNTLEQQIIDGAATSAWELVEGMEELRQLLGRSSIKEALMREEEQ